MQKTRVLSIDLRREFVPSFDKYPFSIPAVRDMNSIELDPDVTFLIGENGTGKSTLVEAIAIAAGMNPEGGGWNQRFSTADTHSELGRHFKLVREIGPGGIQDSFFLRAESFYNAATEIEKTYKEGGGSLRRTYGCDSLHEQSHGELFFSILQHRFGRNGFYLLDEPEAALSPSRQLSALALIHDLVKKHCQFVIATHSPILMAYPNALLYELGPWGIRKVAYEETEHYKVTRAFLLRREPMLRELLADDSISKD